MTATASTVSATVPCLFCNAENVLSLKGVSDVQLVKCSSCGDSLGTVGQIRAYAERQQQQRKASLRIAPRRRTDPEITTAKLARRAARPVQGHLERWRSRIAVLEVYGQRIRSSGRYEPRLAFEVGVILEEVKMERGRFEQQRARLPRSVASHAIINDTLSAIEGIAAQARRQAEAAQAPLRSPPDPRG